MKKLFNNLIEFISNHIIEILIVLGLSLIVLATALINVIASIYTLGTVLILMALFLLFTTN